ncbi:hypothetical protein BDZ94DRAFT_1237539 [Collybia nuda]|uniref:Uncharacterized protein n=1 Tax=Collybia nuda TaxID=64659 RepID=A0A9P5Y5I4_9AGAR|nr:hypothetical protein BDZ94DRAFT_1237539 [Collybia nuda]
MKSWTFLPVLTLSSLFTVVSSSPVQASHKPVGEEFNIISMFNALPKPENLLKMTEGKPEYDNLVYYYKYATSVYSDRCLRVGAMPNGARVVGTINNTFPDTQVFIARHDSDKEIVVAFRGSDSIVDWYHNLPVSLTPFIVSGYYNYGKL